MYALNWRDELRPYFFGSLFVGSRIFSPFRKTAKMACEGQASRQRRQLSRQRDESNLNGGVDSQAPVGQTGMHTAL